MKTRNALPRSTGTVSGSVSATPPSLVGRIQAYVGSLLRRWAPRDGSALRRPPLALHPLEPRIMLSGAAYVDPDFQVDLGKIYSTAESGRFINGILGNFIRQGEAERLRSELAAGATDS